MLTVWVRPDRYDCNHCWTLPLSPNMLDTMFNRSSWSTRSSSVCPDLRPRDHVTSTLISLHWLPIRQRITYKLCTIMHSVFHGLALLYISNIVTPVTHLPGRAHLRSAKNDDNTPRVLSGFGQRSFSVSGPDAWNSLSRELSVLYFCSFITFYTSTCTAFMRINFIIAVASTFKRHLKAELFSRAWLTHPSSAVYS